MIKFDNVSFRYTEDSPYVLNDVSFTINDAEFIGILGHNGSGKSTLAKIFNLTHFPTSGDVFIDEIIPDISEHKSNFDKYSHYSYDVKQRIGVVFQNPDNQIVATIVEDDIAFAPENLGLPPTLIRERVEFALSAVGMLEYRNHAPQMLSGGQKQRIAIAGILAMQPKYIVLDEPTAMLDPMGRREVLSTLRKLNKEKGIGIILITHNVNEIFEADSVIVMDKGRLILKDTPRVALSDVDLLHGIGLGVPHSLMLLHNLRKSGINVRDCLTSDEVEKELSRLIKN